MYLDDLVLFSVPSAFERIFISWSVPLDFAWIFGAGKRGELFVAIRHFATRFLFVFFDHFIIRMPPTRNKGAVCLFCLDFVGFGNGTTKIAFSLVIALGGFMSRPGSPVSDPCLRSFFLECVIFSTSLPLCCFSCYFVSLGGYPEVFIGLHTSLPLKQWCLSDNIVSIFVPTFPGCLIG